MATLSSIITPTNVLTPSSTATLTNKTINLSSNTLIATSAQLASAVTDETGSGALVFGTSPTLTDPKISLGGTNGTAGQVPVSQGAGLPPVWGAKQDTLVSGTNIKTLNGASVLGSGDLTVGGGSMIFLSEITASGSSTVSFTSEISSTYDEYVVHGVFHLSPSGSYFDLSCQLQAAGSWITSSLYYWSAFSMRNSTPTYEQGTPSTSFRLNVSSSGRPYSNSTSNPVMFQCRVRDNGARKLMESVMVASDGGSNPVVTHACSFLDNANALSGIRFIPSTSAFNGKFRLYGIKKS